VVLVNSGADSQPMHILNLFRKRSLIPERLSASGLQHLQLQTDANSISKAR
jgi:hypothetical protein